MDSEDEGALDEHAVSQASRTIHEVVGGESGTGTRAAELIVKILDEHGVKRSGRVLDLGCGIGRHSVHLAKHGYNVVGVDISPTYLRRAQTLARKLRVPSRTKFMECDYRSLSNCLRGEKPFDAIVNISTTIGYYEEKEDLAVLKQSRIKAGRKAILLIETSNRDFFSKHFQPTDYDWIGDLLLLHKRKLDLEKSVIEDEWTYYRREGRNLKFIVSATPRVRVYALQELISILTRAGWRYLASYGGLEQNPLTADSPRRLVLSEAR